MRLGDVDKLLYHKRKVMFFGLGQDDECWGFAVPVEEIDKAPTIDAVPVVKRPVPGYEGYYEVDNLGRVFSVDRIIHVNDNGRIFLLWEVCWRAPENTGHSR